MNNIKAVYEDYDDIINFFGEEEIKGRFKFFVDKMSDFIEIICEETEQDKRQLFINDKILQQCLMDYFSDIYRLKQFHGIGKVNNIKKIAYESAWILRRKPIQVISEDDQKLIYSNEKFVLAYILNELLLNRKDDILTEESSKVYKAFVDSLYYHLKYRNCDAKTLELMILSFKAGLNYNTTPDIDGSVS